MFYILNKESLTAVEMVREGVESTNLFNAGKYSELFSAYDESIHAALQQADSLPKAWIYDEEGNIQVSTPYSLYLLGKYTLGEGEIVEDEAIVKQYKPSSYHDWDYDTLAYKVSDYDGYRSYLIKESSNTKYDNQNGVTLENDTFDNLSEGYNTTMLERAIARYKTYGRKTTWYNLDGTPIVLTDDNIGLLEELGLSISDHIQKCFDTRYALAVEITSVEDSELNTYDLDSRWSSIYNSINYDEV